MPKVFRLHPPDLSVNSRTILTAVIFLILSCHAVDASVSTRFDGPETALPGSTISLTCSWTLSNDDMVFRVMWKIQSALGRNNTLEATVKPNPNEPTVEQLISTGPIQGRISLDARNSVSTLTLRNLTFASEGNYTCLISTISAEKQLTRLLRVIAPPDQIISRLNLTAENSTFLHDGDVIGPYLQGTNFELNCFVAYSRPPATIRWFRKDREGQSFPLESQSGPQRQQMDENGVWRVNRALAFRLDARDLMGNILICQTENEATTHPIQLEYRLDLLVPPASLSLSGIASRTQMREGTMYNLTCEAYDAKPPAVISWMLEGDPVTRFVRTDTIPTINGTFITRSVFTYSANPDDNGKLLTCQALQEVIASKRQEMIEKIAFNIAYSPRNVMTSRSRVPLIEGGRAETDSAGGINCTADANPLARFVWVFDGSVISSSPTLLFNRNISRADSGEYLCIAMNEIGRTNITMNVDVHYRPYCSRCGNSSDPCLIGAAIGEEESIRCEMAAQPATDVTYLWNTNETDDFDLVDTSQDPAAVTTTTEKFDTGLLTMTSQMINYTVRSADDYRRLQCWAKNSVGTSQTPCYFKIVPAGKPNPPENCSIITVMASGFTLKCKPGFDGGYQQKFVLQVFNAEGNKPTQGLTRTRQFNPGAAEPKESPYPEWLEKGLSAGKDYQIEVISKNEAGVSAPIYLPVRTLKADEVSSTLSTTMIAAIAGSLGGFAFLAVLAVIAILCVKNRKKGELHINRPEIKRAAVANTETHSNNSSSTGSKSELVKDPLQQNGRAHPDMANGNGTKGSSLRFQRNGSAKAETPVADVTYTRALDLGKKPFKAIDGIIYADLSLTKMPCASQPVIAPKPPISGSLLNGRSPDRTQYAVIDITKNTKRTAPRPDGELTTQEQLSPKMHSTNGVTMHGSSDGVIRTVAVV